MSFSAFANDYIVLPVRFDQAKNLEKLNAKSKLYQESLKRLVDNSDGFVEQIVEVFSTIPERLR